MAEILIGNATIIHRVSDQIQKAALTELPVIITGESGTGKELAARLLHDLGACRAHKFIKVNCQAITTQAFERALPGRQPSSFTGDGVEQGGKGTLFLDEIAELNLTLQAILLRALEGVQAMSRAGNECNGDIRIVCASSRDLEREVANGRFRIDLFHRLKVLSIRMPSLRERPCDVRILVNHFIMVYGGRFGRRPESLSPCFMRSLEAYHWPGNVRELENLAKRYIVLGGKEQIISALRELEIKPSVPRPKKEIILGLLQEYKWNRKKTAMLMGHQLLWVAKRPGYRLR
jgi:two-component system response regulator AtoC